MHVRPDGLVRARGVPSHGNLAPVVLFARMLRVSRAPVTSVFFVFATHAGEGTVPKISGPGSEKVEGVSRRAELPPDEESMLMASFPRLFSVGWTA